jgi:adenylosuccinate lyase
MNSPAGCRHDRGHITDSRFYGNRYSTPASREIFCDVCRHQRWLDIEAALARAQADLGMLPQPIAEQITAAARVELLDLDAVAAEIDRTGHSLVGLLHVFRDVCPDNSGQYIHFGATTQDIQDTGQSLEMRDVLDALAPLLEQITLRLTELADQHAGTVALGRTHAQPALPIGLGLKFASWVDELLRHQERIRAMRSRVLVAQLFGGAGTMAGFGGHGLKLVERFAEQLGLGVPRIGWHVARDRVAEFATNLAMTAGTFSRIADEIRTLSRPEFGELRERWRPGKVGSSTMPHKRNPEGCEQVVMLAKLAVNQAATAMTAMVGDHERDSRSLRLEWVCVPDVSHYTLAAAQILAEITDGLTVETDRVLANVVAVAEQVTSERLMLGLAEALGKDNAHGYVYAVTQEAKDTGQTVRQRLTARGDCGLSAETLDAIFDPAGYLGDSAALVEAVVTQARVQFTT